VEVKRENNLRILFAQHFPSAEIRYLKNFHADKGHAVTVRTQTSKNNFTYEYINTSKISVGNFSTDLLSSFDLLIIDSKTIEGLSSFEKMNLEKSVSGGLGLIVDHVVSKAGEFYSMKSKAISIDTAHVLLGNKEYVLPALPYEITAQPGIESVLKNKRRSLSGYKSLGLGKIGFQLLQETYRITLEGKLDDYSSIWSTLIERVARKQSKEVELKLISLFPFYPNEPIDFSVISSSVKPTIFFDEIKVPLSEDVIIDDYWHGRIWADKTGWHQLRGADSTALNYFIYDPTEWSSVRKSNLRKQTFLAQKSDNQISGITEATLVSRVLFYFIFLLTSGFLWLAPKV
jgi:hypothetical protein